jgi:hypothetical protein
MKPRILIVYYSFTRQTHRVAEAMAAGFRDAGCEPTPCAIEFIDERYPIEFPFRPVWPKLLRWVWPQVRGVTGKVRVPEDILAGDYDLICIGSPSWWLHPAMPVVSFLSSSAAERLLRGRRFAMFAVCRGAWAHNLRIVRFLGKRAGGTLLDSAAFCFRGNTLQSALSFISYMHSGADRDRYWGVKIYPFGIPEEGLAAARAFARRLADGLKTGGEQPPP